MRQRITFVHGPGNAVEPSALSITDTSISTPELVAAREDRITATFDELPASIARLLRATSAELHVRWVSPVAYGSVSPLSSRMSPGLHVFVTPTKKADQKSLDELAAGLKDVFGLVGLTEASAVGSHFTSLPLRSSSAPAVLQYYEQQESPSAFTSFLRTTICRDDTACSSRADTLETAASVDLSIDTASSTIKLTAQWPHDTQSLSVAATPGHRTEVGILGLDPAAHKEAHELGVSGLLTVLGDTKPSPVVFAIPARHRDAGAIFSAAFVQPTGLHPTLRLAISSPRPPIADADDDSCAIHAHFTLPKTIFADRYQLSDDLFLASKNLTALRYSSSPVDLEAPAYATTVWGSNVLLRLAPPAAGEKDAPWTAEVPLHLRYLEPNPEGYAAVDVPYPAVFWACDAPAGVRLENNPFDRSSLGYDALFDPQTVFWHVEPRPAVGDRVTSRVQVPVLASGDASWVRAGTAAAVLLGFGWVVGTLLRAYLKTGHGKTQAKAGVKGKEKKRQ
ncbi:PIG-X [Plectosphaerella cucumerina]|uniref:Protein PBN1 n=1 Tax=Plectosphaerella cucumerina TaxID=40658 RepID=A0A8K0T6Q5_9PEZI|nr:PIG-X [Plectosphaerella cucumerina]